VPQTSREDAPGVAGPQHAAILAQLGGLAAAEWSLPTDCAGWTVRDIAAHVTGAMDSGAHLRVLLRHLRAARRAGLPGKVDGLNAAQIADRSTCPPERIVEDMRRLAPKAVRARRRAPGIMRRRTVPGDDLPAGSDFAYLFDVIYSRDVWMHRIDISRATGGPLPDCDSDAAVVAQVVRDLGRFWDGPPVLLELTGPAGGTWLLGDGEPCAEVRADTVDYLRLLSGRPGEPELSITGQDAVRAALLAARVAF
jgi:uncharacterized protein (TIGR03083 family)